MENKFSPQEILKIAVKVEENGKIFYETQEKKAKDEKMREVWRYLKEQEVSHIKIFSEMLDNLGDYFVYEFTQGEVDNYLKALAFQYIFTPEIIEKKSAGDFSSKLEPIEFGIGIEKDSILVYSALKDYVREDKSEVLDKIIEEEKKHLSDLIGLYDNYRDETK